MDKFFQEMATPVDFEKEEGGPGSDNLQARTMGLLCLIYGGFVILLMAIPNSLTGRLCFGFCGGTMVAIGGLMHLATRGGKARIEVAARADDDLPPPGDAMARPEQRPAAGFPVVTPRPDAH